MIERRLLIATRNPAKLAEWKHFLSELPCEIVGLADVGIDKEVEETGATFQENARLKAVEYARLSGLIALADDGGFEIGFLNGAPGVRSRRLFGEDAATDEELINFVLEKLVGVPQEKRGAQLRVVAVVALPDGTILYEGEAKLRGYIVEKPSKTRLRGFPYRSIFRVPEFDKMLVNLTEEEHEQVNHRRKISSGIIRAITEAMER
jgi:XTP/dITP diphosphohydrolase